MKYINAMETLPVEMVEQIQKYVQGCYVYIPIKQKAKQTKHTDYRAELDKRDARILTKYLEGTSRKEIARLYNLSESSVRRIIIKQKGRFEDMYKEIRELLIHWNLEKAEIQQAYDTAWYVGNEYVLKVYDDKEMLERNLKALLILEKRNIPVAQIVRTGNNQVYVEQAEKYYLLSKRLPGNNIVDIQKEPGIAKVMGQTIGRLHLAFEECEKEDEFWENSLLGEMNSWIRDVFETSGWKHISKETYDMTLASLKQCYHLLPVQLIHRDVHFGNFLFEQGRFSGYIDFDLSQRNIRIFDLCYFLIGLMSEEEKLQIPEKEWLNYVAEVFRGYEDVNQLTVEEKRAVPYVMEGIELLFAAYFIGENDLICAEDAIRLFEFVRAREEGIYNVIIGEV